MAKRIVVTGCALPKRTLGHVPTTRPRIYPVTPPPGVSNWERVDGPHPVEGGDKVMLRARWMCMEPGQWRALYSDGAVGYPVAPQGPWRLYRGPKEMFELGYGEPVNPRFLGEIVTFEIEMFVSTEDWTRPEARG